MGPLSVDELAERGLEEDFLVIEAIVLSGQMPEPALMALMERAPAFASWLKTRAAERQGLATALDAPLPRPEAAR